jgi:hypothetical protein
MASVHEMLDEEARMLRDIEQMEKLGAVDLDEYQARKREVEEETRLEELGIVNRRSARAAGLRNPPKARSYAIPSKRARHRTRRSK